MINAVTLTGRLTKKPELRYSQSGTAFANSTIAVERSYTNRDGERDTDFIRLTASGKRAETFANYFNKGSLLGVEGKIKTGSYEKNGQTVYTTDVDVSNLSFLEPKNANKGNSQGNDQNAANEGYGPFADGGQHIDVSDDDLPF